MDVRWYGCEVTTGEVLEELPLRPSGQLSHRVGEYNSAGLILDLGLGNAPAGWVEATAPGRTMTVLAIDDVIVWGGMILERKGGTAGTVDLAVVECEGYLDRRYVAEHVWTGQDERVIVSGLVSDAQPQGINFTLDIPTLGTTRDRTYLAKDDKRVYSALQELMAVQDGPEWTVLLDWTDTTRTAVRKTFRARKRIGFAFSGAVGNAPPAVFQTGGESSAAYAYHESYADGWGANHVIATSSGEGDDRPQSAPAIDTDALDGGFPRYELRYQPSTSISNVDTLDDHAAAKLAALSRGLTAFTAAARFDAYPRLGVDWQAGDDVGMELLGHRHPDGVVGIGRALGWTLDLQAGLIAPDLVIEGEEL
jgi:hypothetical protein